MNGERAKPTVIKVFLNPFFICLFGNIINPTINKYKDFKNQVKPEEIRIVANLGGLISPKYNEAKFSNTLLGIILIKAVIIIIDIAKYIPASPKFLLSLYRVLSNFSDLIIMFKNSANIFYLF